MNFLSYMVVEISLTKNTKRKKTEHKQGKINRVMLVLSPTIQQYNVNLHTNLEQLLRNLLRKIRLLIAWRETNDNKYMYKEEQTGQRWLSIPRYNLSLLFCIPNMNFLFYTVVEISLTKKVERQKNG